MVKFWLGGVALARSKRFNAKELARIEAPPILADPHGGDFTPGTDSPLIDRGLVIPGINDGFESAGPDIGAFEYGTPLFADGFESGDLSGWTIAVW